jgi:hypothetical protein
VCATRVRRTCSNRLVRRTKQSNKNAVCGALYYIISIKKEVIFKYFDTKTFFTCSCNNIHTILLQSQTLKPFSRNILCLKQFYLSKKIFRLTSFQKLAKNLDTFKSRKNASIKSSYHYMMFSNRFFK